MAVNYVNKETLLTEMPYQLNEGSPLPVDITQSMTFDPVQSNQAIYVMNLVKQQENQAAFQFLHKAKKMPKHCIKRWLTIHQQFCRQIDKQNCYKRERNIQPFIPFI